MLLRNNLIKNFNLIAAFVAIFLCACKENKKQDNAADKSDIPAYAGSKEVNITGSIANGENQWLTLVIFDNGAQVAMDSVKLNADGAFKFTIKPTNIDFYRLKVGSIGFINLLLDNTSDLTINANTKSLDNYTITGGKHTELFATLDKELKVSYHKTDSINDIYKKAADKKEDESTLDKLKERLQRPYDEVVIKRIDFARNFLKANHTSPAAISATQFLDPAREPDLFIMLDTSLTRLFPKNKYVNDFHARYSDLAKKLPIGIEAPDIIAQNPIGKRVSLSSLRGKYVLIDFWASWCRPCRIESPNMVNLYKKYKNKGFEIFSVSLDKDKQEWIRAVYNDKLSWTHVSDLKEWKSPFIAAYYIQAIPYTCLIDKNGKVLAKGLSAEELDKKLAEILK